MRTSFRQPTFILLAALRCWLCIIASIIVMSACGGSSESRQVFSSNPGATATPLPPAPTATPDPDPMATATPTVTPMPTLTPSPTVTPTVTVMPTPTVTPDPTMTPAPVTLAALQADIFTPICARCHTPGGQAASTGLFLDSETNSFNNLVNVGSTGSPGQVRVIPNNPDDSYLVRKIEGGPAIEGLQMPRGGTPLSAQRMANVRSWIAGGALPTASASSTQILSAKMDVEENLSRYQIQASRAIDPDSLSEGAVLVYAISGEDRQLVAAENVSVTAFNNLLEIVVEHAGINFDEFEIELNNPALSAVMDTEGRLLDGDHDQQDGGIYIYRP